jgi:hypothetical protein
MPIRSLRFDVVLTARMSLEYGARWTTVRMILARLNWSDTLYLVEIRRAQADVTRVMASIREWLDQHRYEPDSFRSRRAMPASFSGSSSNTRAGPWPVPTASAGRCLASLELSPEVLLELRKAAQSTLG